VEPRAFTDTLELRKVPCSCREPDIGKECKSPVSDSLKHQRSTSVCVTNSTKNFDNVTGIFVR